MQHAKNETAKRESRDLFDLFGRSFQKILARYIEFCDSISDCIGIPAHLSISAGSLPRDGRSVFCDGKWERRGRPVPVAFPNFRSRETSRRIHPSTIHRELSGSTPRHVRYIIDEPQSLPRINVKDVYTSNILTFPIFSTKCYLCITNPRICTRPAIYHYLIILISKKIIHLVDE